MCVSESADNEFRYSLTAISRPRTSEKIVQNDISATMNLASSLIQWLLIASRTAVKPILFSKLSGKINWLIQFRNVVKIIIFWFKKQIEKGECYTLKK